MLSKLKNVALLHPYLGILNLRDVIDILRQRRRLNVGQEPIDVVGREASPSERVICVEFLELLDQFAIQPSANLDKAV